MSVNAIRAKIFSAKDRTTEDVECPEWDCKIRVMSLSGRERNIFERQVFGQEEGDTKGMDNATAIILSMCCYDPDTNEKLFTEKDVELLSEKSSAVLARLSLVAKRLSGMLPSESKEIVKN